MRERMKGFSLAEVMIAIGILGAVSLGVMRLVRMQSDQQKKSETEFELNTVFTNLTQHLQNSESCRTTLSALGNITTNKNITQIKNRNGSVIYEINKPYGGRNATSGPVVIEKMEILDTLLSPLTITPSVITAGNTGHGQLVLNITFRRDSKMVTGLKKISRTLPLSVELNSSYTVTKCFTAYENATESAMAVACDSIKGSFNPATDMCELTAFSFPSNVTDFLPPDDPSMAISTDYLQSALNNTSDPTRTRFNMERRYVNTTGDTMTGELNLSTSGKKTTSENIRATTQVCVEGRCRDFTRKECPAGQILLRINGDGSIACKSLGVCPANQYLSGLNADGSAKCVALNGATCPAGQYVVSIAANGSVTCAAVNPRPNISCPAGQYIEQISASWVPTCRVTPIDTNTNVYNRYCPAGQAVRGFSSTGVPTCGAY